ncbi:MAG: hypothetical protein JWN44_5297 [Myxococcales bacterium]|nr:hypothetical protein [Myxococcales bacterium]
MTRSRRTDKPAIRARRATPKLPRIVVRKPRRGDVHPLATGAVRAFLRALPPEQIHGLAAVELRARVDGVGEPFAIYRREDRVIILYSLPPDEWWMGSILPDIARSLRAAGATVLRHRPGVSIHWSSSASLAAWLRDEVLAHEVGHHVRNQYAARWPRAARTVDEEAVADLHARRTKRRLG